MNRATLNSDVTKISVPASLAAIAAAGATLLLLACLHVLSPEFSPAWRMVSEYADGRHGFVLSLMFATWGFSSWALAFAIRSQVQTAVGKIGLAFLTVAGIGEAMAAVFDINHDAGHSLAGALGVLGLPIAAMLISLRLSRSEPWTAARSSLLWTANLTWVSVVLLVVTFALMIATVIHATGGLPAQAPRALPPGVIAMVGWADRLLVASYCAWVIAVGWQALKVRRPDNIGLRHAPSEAGTRRRLGRPSGFQ